MLLQLLIVIWLAGVTLGDYYNQILKVVLFSYCKQPQYHLSSGVVAITNSDLASWRDPRRLLQSDIEGSAVFILQATPVPSEFRCCCNAQSDQLDGCRRLQSDIEGSAV